MWMWVTKRMTNQGEQSCQNRKKNQLRGRGGRRKITTKKTANKQSLPGVGSKTPAKTIYQFILYKEGQVNQQLQTFHTTKDKIV